MLCGLNGSDARTFAIGVAIVLSFGPLLYLNDVSKSKLLTPAEEIAVARRVQKGDQEAMDELGARTGRRYGLFDYVGHPQAERVLVLMGSGAEVAHETIEWLVARGAVAREDGRWKSVAEPAEHHPHARSGEQDSGHGNPPARTREGHGQTPPVLPTPPRKPQHRTGPHPSRPLDRGRLTRGP